MASRLWCWIDSRMPSLKEEWRKHAGPKRKKVASGPSKEGYRASARKPAVAGNLGA